MFITLFGVYIVILGLMTLTLFQGHRFVRNVNYKFCLLDSCPAYFKRCMMATYIKKIMHNIVLCVSGVYSCFPLVKCLCLSKTLALGFSETL